ncbi:MAG: ABC transporter ATP-binding protein [Desulfuromonadaceae bacterium]|nr:ABC transporter ATP-binding protein [Desulfuromonadaceae bacterium]
MFTLWKYLKPHKGLMSASLVLAVVAHLLHLVDPIIFGVVIDTYATGKTNLDEPAMLQGVLFWLALAIAIAILARLLKGFQEFLTRLAVARFGMDIFNEGLKQTLRLSFQEFESSRSGETLSLMQKVKTDTERFVNSLINVLLTSFIGIGFLVWYSVTKTCLLIPVFLIGLGVLGALTGLLSKKIKTVQRAINRQTHQLSGVITESLRNIELIKCLGLSYQEIKRLNLKTRDICDLEIGKAKKVISLSFAQGVALNFLKQSIFFILLWLIFRNVLTTGQLIAMQFISNAIFQPLQEMGNIILHWREVEASVNNFEALMGKPVEIRPEHPDEIGPLERIRFEQVTFRHRSASFNAIDGISFDVRSGETIAFVGPSGSGKSTLVKLLVGLYKPATGDIYFNNASSANIRYNPLRRQIGFVTQETQLFAGSIKENMLLVKMDASDEEILEALHKAQAVSFLERAPAGIDTVIGENGLKLSGGEKQRISIARALLRQPRLLIFDEATSSLDSATEEEITQTMREISANGDQITLLIAHRLSTIMHADVIYVLERGKIVETGTHGQLLSQKGLYYALWRQQIGERGKDAEEVFL